MQYIPHNSDLIPSDFSLTADTSSAVPKSKSTIIIGLHFWRNHSGCQRMCAVLARRNRRPCIGTMVASISLTVDKMCSCGWGGARSSSPLVQMAARRAEHLLSWPRCSSADMENRCKAPRLKASRFFGDCLKKFLGVLVSTSVRGSLGWFGGQHAWPRIEMQ